MVDLIIEEDGKRRRDGVILHLHLQAEKKRQSCKSGIVLLPRQAAFNYQLITSASAIAIAIASAGQEKSMQSDGNRFSVSSTPKSPTFICLTTSDQGITGATYRAS